MTPRVPSSKREKQESEEQDYLAIRDFPFVFYIFSPFSMFFFIS